jgi:putative lipoic acid-binding regulatory protein
VQEPEAPKIEFPCDYPIKVIGVSSDTFEPAVLEVFERHAPGFNRQNITGDLYIADYHDHSNGF